MLPKQRRSERFSTSPSHHSEKVNCRANA
jgi:hypothetical protein